MNPEIKKSPEGAGDLDNEKGKIEANWGTSSFDSIPRNPDIENTDQVKTIGEVTRRDLFQLSNLNGLPVDFLDGFSFPSAAIVVIGAKTGGGKTTAQINVAREALTQGKTVGLITFELSADDLVLQLALSFYALHNAESVPNWTRNDPGPGIRIHDVDRIKDELPEPEPDANPDFDDTFTIIKSEVLAGRMPTTLRTHLERVLELLDEGKLRIWQYPGTITEVARIIEETDLSVYLVDYLQVIPPPEGISRETYKGTQAVCDVFRKLGNHSKNLIFLGAQFNRQAGEETTRGAFDPRLEQFREAGDIEQMATIALGIGYETDEEGRKSFFYKILKHRYAGRMTGAKIKSFGFFEYYLALRGGRWTPGEKWTTPTPPRKLQGNQKIVLEMIEADKPIKYDVLLIMFKRATGKNKYTFDIALNSLIGRGLANREGDQIE